MKFRPPVLVSLLAAVVVSGWVSLALAQSSNANGRVVTDEFSGGDRTCGTPVPTPEEMQAVQRQVDHWLRTGSGVPGYIGFAIGRSIWWDPLKGFVDGNLGREEAAKQIAANYRRFMDVYNGR